MLLTIFFIILFTLCFLGVLLYPKCEGTINAIKAGVMSVIAIFSYMSLLAFVYNKIGIPINLKSDVLSLMIANIILWTGIIRKKKTQKVFVRVWDALCLILLAAFVLYLSYIMFGTDLRLSYANTDPANHFHYAMNIVTKEKLDSGIYFSAYIDAVFIQLTSFALKFVTYYKGFILADIFMHVMEIWAFYVLVLTISEKRIVRILAPVFSIMYFWGYPAYSYLEGGFVYWSNGVVILIFMIYALVLFERHWDKKIKTPMILLGLGVYANSCCNRLFVPINTFAVAAALVMIIWKKGRVSKKTAVVVGSVFAVGLLFVCGVFAKYWGGNGIMSIIENMIAYVSTPHGGFYRAMYADNIYFIPLFLLAIYYVCSKPGKYTAIHLVITVCMVMCMTGMLAVWYANLMSTYYFYKIYYNLWLMGMILAVFVLDIMADEKQLTTYFSYASMIVLMIVISMTCYDDNNQERDYYYDSYYATEKVMPLYRYNLDYACKDFEDFRIPDGLLAAVEFVMEDEEYGQIPITAENVGIVRWYEGISVQTLHDLIGSLKLPDTVRYMDENGITKIVVCKTDLMYEQYIEFYSACEVLYENPEVMVLSNGGTSWCELLEQNVTESEE